MSRKLRNITDYGCMLIDDQLVYRSILTVQIGLELRNLVSDTKAQDIMEAKKPSFYRYEKDSEVIYQNVKPRAISR